MSRLFRFRLGLLIVIGGLLASRPLPAFGADPEVNLARVKGMSRDDRAALAKAIERFDALPGDEKAAIRALDAGLAGLEPEARSRLMAVLRRYHVFYTNLPKEKQKALDAAGPAKRLDLVAAYRAEESLSPKAARAVADGIQVSTLSPVRLRALARELIVYFNLDPVVDAKARAEFALKKSHDERMKFTNQLIKSKAFAERVELAERLHGEDVQFQIADQAVRRNPELARRLKKGEEQQSRFEQAVKKKVDNARSKEAAANPRDALKVLVQKLEEQQLLRDFDSEQVAPSRLDGFEAALPPWARQSFDELPPDAAKRRLKALYRLVFPSPLEYEPPKAPEPPPKPNRVSPPPEGGQGTPF